MFQFRETASSFDRLPVNGFRCVRYLSAKIPPSAVKDIPEGRRNWEKDRPVCDEGFQIIKSIFSYDKASLNAHPEHREESADSIHETVTFDAAYGKERVIAHLYLPRQGIALIKPWSSIRGMFFSSGSPSLRKTRRTRLPSSCEVVERSCGRSTRDRMSDGTKNLLH